MQRTIKVRLNLPEADIKSLRDTQRLASSVFNDHVQWSFEAKTWSKAKAHKELYLPLRAKYHQFPSGLLQTVRDTALEAIKAVKFKFRPKKSENSGVRYDSRLFKLRGQQLTLSSINGRVKTVIEFPKWCKEVVEQGKLQSLQLCWNKKQKQFYANLVFKLDNKISKADGTVIGLDRGLVNLVTTSDGEILGGKKLRKSQRKFLYLRRKLSAKGTHSAKRLLKKLSGKEKRFSREVNHIITKDLASKEGVKTYVLENLKGIRSKRRGKKLNKLLSSWTFSQFETLLKYKCEARGISVVKVDARYTSQRCSCCGTTCKENRKGGRYICNHCGFKKHADVNAAINIRDRWIIGKPFAQQDEQQGAVNHPNGDNES